MWIPFALALLAAEPTDDDCTLSRDALVGVLDASKVQGYAVDAAAAVVPAPRTFTERGTVGGRAVSYDVGGCAHYAFTFGFAVLPEDGGRGAVALARALLASLPVVSNERARMNTRILHAALDAAKFELPIAALAPEALLSVALPCGDASCGLTLTRGRLSVSYDFPL